MISSRVRMSALVSWWSQRLLHKHNIHSLIPGRRTCLSLLTTKHNNQSSGDKSTDWCCLDLARDLPWFCPFPGLPLLSVSPPPHATSTSSGRVSGRRPQALWRGEPQVHLSLPFMCSTEALSLFVDHSVVAAAWQKDWRATGGGGAILEDWQLLYFPSCQQSVSGVNWGRTCGVIRGKYKISGCQNQPCIWVQIVVLVYPLFNKVKM